MFQKLSDWVSRKPRSYRHAQKNIGCECPKCHCPARNGGEYSFTYIREKRSFIYYDVPKCASTTIRQGLFNGDNALSMRDPRGDLNDYFTFTFVRNPWDRMVSNWKMFTTIPFRVRQLKSMTDLNLSDFGDFVAFAQQMKNHHWQPQVLYLPPQLDFVGKLERFDEDYEFVLSRIGRVQKTVAVKNATTKGDYRDSYTSTLVETVGEMYADDVTRFGYTFGD